MSTASTPTDVNLAQLENKYGHKLDNLQLTGDGKVDRAQMLNLLSENDKKSKRNALLAGTLIFLLALTVAALSWALAGVSTKVSTETTTAHGALVDKADTGAALRVAPGVVNLAAAYKSTMVPTSIPVQGGKAIYRGSLDTNNVLQGCRLLLDGSKTFTTMVPLLIGGNVSSDFNAAKSVEVVFANTTACKNAINTGNVDRVLGAIMLDGEQLMYVTCRQETGCHAYQQVPTSNNSTSTGKRRRSLLNTEAYPLLQSIGVANAVNKRKILQTPSPAPASPPAPVEYGDGENGINTYNDVKDTAEVAEALIHSGNNVPAQPSPSPDEDNGGEEPSPEEGPVPDGPVPDAPVDPAEPSDPSDSGNSGANDGPAPDAPVDNAAPSDPSDSGNSNAPADSGNEGSAPDPAGGDDSAVVDEDEGAGGGFVDEDPEIIGCFPRMATVQLHDGTQKRMYQLVPGDQVLSVDNQGQMTYSPIYVLPHAIPNVIYDYRRFTVAAVDDMNNENNTNVSNIVFETTPDHYLLLAPQSVHEENGSWSVRRAVRAAEAKVGDKMWMADSTKNTMQLTTILAVEDILDEGIFSPLTLTGTIVVDGVVASVYSDMLGSEYNMHVFCAWGRWLYRIWPQFFTGMHQLNLASPVAMQLGYAAKAVMKMVSAI